MEIKKKKEKKKIHKWRQTETNFQTEHKPLSAGW